MKIYTTSSWRNPFYDDIVHLLKMGGHEVYDFRSTISTEGKTVAFNWDQIDPDWENWTPEEFDVGIRHPLAKNAFHADFEGMNNADVCVLILPSGKSAHIEAGYMKGLGKKLYILMLTKDRPELTYSIADKIFGSFWELSLELQKEVQ